MKFMFMSIVAVIVVVFASLLSFGQGKNKGYEQGKMVGHETGFKNGEEDGYNSGYDDGYKNGYDDGKKSGMAQSRTEQFLKGYDTGFEAAKKTYERRDEI